ncbi:hypothetical protein [Zoogloea sp.]|uniref:hypothetical protein n=1 Tax=Zoogloea sp. TaxID=49181 RepID=UPI002616B07E|nr:hypothetical protein [Zoogloea sp.]
MSDIRHLIAASLIGSLALGLSLPASAGDGHGHGRHGGYDRGEYRPRHDHRHHHDRGAYYYSPPPVYAVPPRVVYERPMVYSPQPVYAYPARSAQSAVTIDIGPLVIPFR